MPLLSSTDGALPGLPVREAVVLAPFQGGKGAAQSDEHPIWRRAQFCLYDLILRGFMVKQLILPLVGFIKSICCEVNDLYFFTIWKQEMIHGKH